MLKIKDNVDLKELERFGFKPRYDEDSGKLIEMYRIRDFYNLNEKCKRKTTTITLKEYRNLQVKDCSLYKNFWHILKKDKKVCPDTYYVCLDIEDYEILYDLIQAGLVEKVDK